MSNDIQLRHFSCEDVNLSWIVTFIITCDLHVASYDLGIGITIYEKIGENYINVVDSVDSVELHSQRFLWFGKNLN